MEVVSVPLSEAQTEYVRARAQREGCDDVAHYITRLIVEDQKREARIQLEELLLDGVRSGDPVEATPEFWKQLEGDLVARHQKNADTREA